MPSANGKGAGRDSELCPFHALISGTLTAGLSGFVVQPSSNFGTRVVAIADAWAHFRVKSLAIRLHPAATTATATCYVGGVQDTPPATILDVMQVLSATIIGGPATVPSEWVRPTRSELSGPIPWYKSVAGSADATEEAPGQIVVAGTTTAAFLLEMRGVFEFKTAVGTANTPQDLEEVLARRARRQELERRQARANLLRIMGNDAPPSSGRPFGGVITSGTTKFVLPPPNP